jgi:phage antirepressor YoqD-like protein
MNKPVFIYKGFEITFQNDDGSVMVNATEMARPFNKRPVDWLNLSSSQNYIQALREVRYPNITPAESAGLIQTVRGNYSDGSQQGTWMHEDVALEFARWLSPSFAIWCNDRIKELMKVGMTAMPQTVEAMLADPDLVIGLATQLKTERQKVREQAAVITSQQTALKEAEPKVLFADSVSASESSILIGELAKILKQNGIEIGQNRLFEWMRNNDYLCSRGESYNLPTQRAMELKLFEIKKTSITQPDGTVFVTSTTKVTPKGQMYFVRQFLYGRA